MCKLCDEGRPQDHSDSRDDSASHSRRDFLKAGTAGTAAAAAGLGLFTERVGAAQDDDDSPVTVADTDGAM